MSLSSERQTSDRLAAEFNRVRNLPTKKLPGGTIAPVGSYEDRMRWYELRDQDEKQALREAQQYAAERKPPKSATEKHLEYLEEQLLEAKLATMSPREKFFYTKARETEKKIAAEQAHEEASKDPRVARVLGTIERLLATTDGAHSVKFAATAKALKNDPANVQFYAQHVRDLLKDFDSGKREAFNEANNELAKARSEAEAAYAKGQAETERHRAAMLQAGHDLDAIAE